MAHAIACAGAAAQPLCLLSVLAPLHPRAARPPPALRGPPRVAHLRLQEPEAALPPLRKLHALVPDNPEAIHCIALAHDMMGDTQARRAQSTTCRPSSFHSGARRGRQPARAQVGHASALAPAPPPPLLPQGAVRWLELLTSLVPNDPGVLCKLGAIHYR